MQSKSEMIVSQTGEILKNGIASCHESKWTKIFGRMTFPHIRNFNARSFADDIVPVQPDTFTSAITRRPKSPVFLHNEASNLGIKELQIKREQIIAARI